jgi:hypothetical protein
MTVVGSLFKTQVIIKNKRVNFSVDGVDGMIIQLGFATHHVLEQHLFIQSPLLVENKDGSVIHIHL